MSLFESGIFTLHSGEESSFKIECDALTDSDWDTLAQIVAKVYPHARSITGIPTGGLKFAEALRRHIEVTGEYSYGSDLIVDDVVTTGASFWQYYEGEGTVAIAAFSRGGCQMDWVWPIFTLRDSPYE